MQRISLVKLAHELIGNMLGSGDIAIDATVGNGYDTAFLASQVSPSGRVYGFDTQQEAIAATAVKLGDLACVTLIHASHAKMLTNIPVHLHGKVCACMFNLGYLPGGDKRMTTNPESTLTALTCANRMLATGGIITVIAYPSHQGGDQETERVKNWCGQLDATQHTLKTIYSDESNPAAPILFVICKTGGTS